MTKATAMTAGPRQHAMHAVDGPTEHTLVREHGALVRQLASLQRRWSEQWVQLTSQQRRLDAEVVRLRGRLLQARTALLWGVGHPASGVSASALNNHRLGAPRVAPPPGCPDGSLREAGAVLCQTACTGHAHPWRTADGLCQRTGEACQSDAGRLPGIRGAGLHRPDAGEASPSESDRTRTCG